MHKLLICDDDPLFHIQVKQTTQGKFECQSAYHGDEAVAILKHNKVDGVLLDIQMRSLDEGLKFIPKLLQTDPDSAIMMSSGISDFKFVREAMQLGAVDYILKDSSPNEFLHSIERALQTRTLLRHPEQRHYKLLNNTSEKEPLLIGDSPAILKLKRNLEKIKSSHSNVVITGETGTGKELVARHLRQSTPDGTLLPLIAVDSATIQSSMAESILFGHEKGAFTGADRIRKGVFEEANGGTIYFDEISNMPLEIQAKLLRVLQEKEVTRLGSTQAIQLNFRIICATNKDLNLCVKEGTFKYDFFQRIHVIPIFVPPLRERQSDIPLLIEYFSSKHCVRESPIKFSHEVIDFLCSYHWPGNIRELSNCIACMSTMSENNIIELPELFEHFHTLKNNTDLSTHQHNNSNKLYRNKPFYKKVADFEASLLKDEYEYYKGNISQLALALKMDRSHLYSKLKEYGIHSSRLALS